MKRIICIIFLMLLVAGCSINTDTKVDETDNMKEIEVEDSNSGYIIDSIEIKNIDGKNYEFIYNNEIYNVIYVNDTWKIYNSYKITNTSDIIKICKALSDIHKIPSSDYESYRTEDDMAYEWLQHNLAYRILPDSNSFRNSAKDVDLDPKDQGKSLVEIYEDRTGKKLDLKSLLK